MSKKSFYLSSCLIVKDEAPYLQELIEFHLLQGVEHFFIYENESTDDTWQILKMYELLGIATIEKVATPPDGKTQKPTYEKCLKDHGKKTKWLFFHDADEFLYGIKELPDLLKDYEEFPAVAVNWIFYGSSGHTKHETGLVIERFTKRDKEANQHVKSIVQPELTISTGNNAHYFVLKGMAVNENKVKQPEKYYWTTPTTEIFSINHYHTKSKEEYMKRKASLDVDGVERGSNEDRFRIHDRNHIECGFSELFIKKVKDNMSISRYNFLNRVWEQLDPKPWQVRAEFIEFLKFIGDKDIKSILEIGTHKGGSASAFLAVGCSVTSVDIIKQPEIENLENHPGYQFTLRENFQHLEEFEKYDLLFIDGDHSYEGCKKDFEDYAQYVKPGGYIAFHDVVKSELHKTQGCEVWKFIQDLYLYKGINILERVDFITEGNWGGITVLKF